MLEKANAFRAVHLDFGTGDGRYAQRLAQSRADSLVLGVDAAAENLRDVSFRASRKPARGGLANALFGVLALADAPGELVGLADSLTVLLPWGSLLGAVARGELQGLRALRGTCKETASVRFVFGYGARDAAAVDGMALPSLDDESWNAELIGRYAEAGFAVRIPEIGRDEVRALGTTWAAKLAFGSAARRFVEISGAACAPANG